MERFITERKEDPSSIKTEVIGKILKIYLIHFIMEYFLKW